MAGFIRRVVTGHDRNGKSVVISDGPAPVTNRDRTPRRHRRTTDLWLTSAMPAPISAEEVDPTLEAGGFVVPMGTKLRINEFEPEPPEIRTLPLEQAIEYLKSVGNDTFVPRAGGDRQSAMHRTRTIDYAVVLEGEMTLYIGEQELLLKTGDVVIQRGTKHGWRNRSDKRVRMLYVLIDARFEPELARLFESEAH